MVAAVNPTPSQDASQVEEVDRCGILIMRVRGNLNANHSLLAAVDHAHEAGTKWVILNFDRATAVSSAGVGMLVRCYAHCCQMGGRLAVVDKFGKMKGAVLECRLLCHFEFFDTEDTAFESLVKDIHPTIHVRKSQGIVILQVAGDLAVGDLTLQQQLEDLLATGKLYFVLNMSGVTFLGDSVLGGLIGIWARGRDRGVQLKIANPSAHVRNCLKSSRLDTVLAIFESEEDACKTFRREHA
jgi:anti-anti-sigma factor